MGESLLSARPGAAPGPGGVGVTLSSLRIYLFAGLYEVWKKNFFGKSFFQFSVLLQTLQLIYLAFVLGDRGLWTNGAAQIVIRILRPVSEVVLATTSVPIFICAVTFALCFTWLPLIGLVIISRRHVHAKKSMGRVLTFLGITLRLLQTVLLQPVLTILVRAWPCSETSAALITCGTPLEHVKRSVLGLSLPIVVLLSTSHALFVIQVEPFSTSASGRIRVDGYRASHGRIEWLVTMLRAFVIMSVISIDVKGTSMVSGTSSAAEEIIMLSALGVSALGVAVPYAWYLPFYNMSWNHLAATSYSAFLWTVIALLCAHAVRDPSDSSSIYLWIIGLPFVCYTAAARVRARMMSLASSKTPLSSNPYIAEVQLRLQHVTSCASLSGRLPRVEEFVMDGPVFDAYNDALIDHFSESAYFQLLLASWTLMSRKKMIYGLKRIKAAKDHGRLADQDFVLFCLNMNIRERQVSVGGAASYMEFDRQLHKAKDLILRSLKLMSCFWESVQNGAGIEDLIQSGRSINKASTECRQTIRKLLRMSESSSAAMRWQATFTAYVLNDIPAAINIMSRCSTESNMNTRTGYAVCTISADAASLGKVLEVTEALCQLFGYERSEIVGRNVKMLCPEPFDAVHDQFLRHFLESDTSFGTKTRRIYGRNKDGHIIPVDFVITPSTTLESNLILIGTFIERPLQDGTHLLMVNAASLVITGVSEFAVEALRLNHEELYSGNLRITDVIPNFLHRDKSPRYSVERDVTYQGQPYGLRSRRLEFASRPGSVAKYNVATHMVSFTLRENVTAEDLAHFSTIRASPSNRFSFSQKTPSLNSGKSRDRMAQVPTNAASRAISQSPSRGRFRAPLTSSVQRSPSMFSSGTSAEASTGKTTVQNANRGSNSSPGVPFDTDSLSSGAQEASVPGSRQIEILRRKLASNLRVQDPIVAAFSRFLFRFNICCFVVAAVNTIWVSRTYREYKSEVDNVDLILEEAHLLALVPTYVFFANHFPFANVVDLLSATASRLFDLHLSIIAKAQNNLEPALEAMLYAPTLRSPLDLGNAELDGTSFYIAILDALEHIEDILVDASADTIQCGENCAAVESLVTMDPIPAAQRIASLYVSRSSALLERLDLIDLTYLVVTSVLLSLAFFLGYLPLIMNVASQRARLRLAFLSIPHYMCSFLQAKTRERHVAIKEGKTPTVARLHSDQAEMNNDGTQMSSIRERFSHQSGNSNMSGGVSKLESGAWTRKFRSKKRMASTPLMGPSQRSLGQLSASAKAKVTPLAEEADDNVWLAPETQISRAMSGATSISCDVAEILQRSPSASRLGHPLARDSIGASLRNISGSKKSLSSDQHGHNGKAEEHAGPEEDELTHKVSQSSRLSRRSSIDTARQALVRMSTAISTQSEAKLQYPERDMLEVFEENALLFMKRLWKRLRSAARIGFTYWCMLGHFIYIMTQDGQHLASMPAMAASVHVAGLRFVHTHAIMFYAVQPPSEESLRQLNEHTAQVEIYDRALNFGNSSLGVKPFADADGDLFDLNFVDACGTDCVAHESLLLTSNTTSECLAFDLRLGLSFALRQFLDRARRVSSAMEIFLALQAEGASMENALADVEDSQVILRDFQGNILLGQQLEQAMRIYTNSIDTQVESIFWEKLSSLFVLASLLVAGRLVAGRVFRELDEELTNIKSLVLGLPSDVFTHVPSMFAILKMEKG